MPSTKEITVAHKRHKKFWRRSLKILRPILSKIYNYEFTPAPSIEGNYIVLCNHNSNLDPWLCALSFEKQMYFLAAENIFRLGPVSWLIKNLWAPISKLKGKSDASAIINMMRYLRAGYNVSLFPEGNRSFTGVTGKIFPATGKLVKTSKASLVTFRIRGMYFTTPRWAKRIRRGKTWGAVVGVYSPEKLAEMSHEEINELIQKDLSEDAYETQATQMIPYKSSVRAEGIESALYLCPVCKNIGSIKSKKSEFHCVSCKSKAEFTEYGYIKGDFPFKTIPEWDMWQKNALTEIAEKSGGAVILKDSNVRLITFTESHKERIIDTGSLCIYADRITIGNTELLFEQILDMSIVFRNVLLIVCKGNKYYELKSKTIKSVRHYLTVFKYFTENANKGD